MRKYIENNSKIIITISVFLACVAVIIQSSFSLALDNENTQIYTRDELSEKIVNLENDSTLFLKVYPVGSIYLTTNSTNPSEIYGGTWVAWGSGRVPVGVDASNSFFSSVEQTGGSMMHAHMMPIGFDEGNNLYLHTDINYQPAYGGRILLNQVSLRISSELVYPFNSNIREASTEGSSSLQPYITCYMWKRVA